MTLHLYLTKFARPILAAGVLFVSVTLPGLPAGAETCNQSLISRVLETDYAFLGTVQSVKESGRVAEISVGKALRAPDDDPVEVTGKKSTTSEGNEIAFEVGKTYAILASDEDGKVVTDKCAGTVLSASINGFLDPANPVTSDTPAQNSTLSTGSLTWGDIWDFIVSRLDGSQNPDAVDGGKASETLDDIFGDQVGPLGDNGGFGPDGGADDGMLIPSRPGPDGQIQHCIDISQLPDQLRNRIENWLPDLPGQTQAGSICLPGDMGAILGRDGLFPDDDAQSTPIPRDPSGASGAGGTLARECRRGNQVACDQLANQSGDNDQASGVATDGTKVEPPILKESSNDHTGAAVALAGGVGVLALGGLASIGLRKKP